MGRKFGAREGAETRRRCVRRRRLALLPPHRWSHGRNGVRDFAAGATTPRLRASASEILFLRPQTRPIPRRRTRDSADRIKQRATAGAWVPEPDGRGCATILANAGREIARNRPFGCVTRGGDGPSTSSGGLASLPSAVGAYPRLNARVPIVPAPGVGRHLRRSPPEHFRRKCDRQERRAPAVNAERRPKH